MKANQALAIAIANAKSVAPGAITSAVEDWLDEHVDPDTGYVIDDTLLVEGAAADAKKTGYEIADLKSAVNNIVNDANLVNSTYGLKYFAFPIKSGHIYRFTNLCSNTVAIKTSDSDGGDAAETISVGLDSSASITYTATADRDYLRIYFNVAGTVTVSELNAKNTQLLVTSPYHKLLFKYDAKALGGNTDDDVALQNYINDEIYVYIPAGTYRLKNPLTITKVGQVIEGESYGFKTKLMPYDNTVTSLIVASSANLSTQSLMLNIRNICFHMVNYDGTFNPNPAITSNNIIIDSKIENCWFNGGSTSAALGGKAMSFQAVHTMVLGCWFEMFDTAVEIKNTVSNGESNGFVFDDCTFWNNTNAMLLSGKGTVRGCNFSAMKGGFVLKSPAKSSVIFSDNVISLSAPSDLDTTIYTTATGKVIETAHKDACLFIRGIDVFDGNDGSSYYEYLLNAPSGKVNGRNINSASCKHLAVKNSVNADVYFAENPLADVCAAITEEDDRIILDGLLPDCSMAITSESANSVMVTNRNAANVFDKTLTAGGYIAGGQSEYVSIVLSPGEYSFKMDCAGYTSGNQGWVALYDSEGTRIYYSNYVSIADTISFDFTLESAVSGLKIYMNSAGTYSNIIITPKELKNEAYEAYHGEIITIGAGETVRVPQYTGKNIIYAYGGDVTVNAVQTPLKYIESQT